MTILRTQIYGTGIIKRTDVIYLRHDGNNLCKTIDWQLHLYSCIKTKSSAIEITFTFQNNYTIVW